MSGAALPSNVERDLKLLKIYAAFTTIVMGGSLSPRSRTAEPRW